MHIDDSSTKSSQFADSVFNIFDHLNALNIVKETATEYHCTCPLCGDGGFKIQKTGERRGWYNTHKCGCMSTDPGKKAIINAIAPLDYDQRPSYSRPRQKPTAKAQAIPAINGEVKIAKLAAIPTDRPPKVNGRIVYQYSVTQGIDRVEKANKDKPKGYDKDFYQWHIAPSGERKNNKGNDPWPLYRESEAISAAGYPVLVEGEECVEELRAVGIAAMTFQGSSWSSKAIAETFNRLTQQGIPGLIFIPDQDQAGIKKAIVVEEASKKSGLPVIIVDIKSIWPEAPEWADVADIQWGTDMNQAEFIRRLEAEIHQALEIRNARPLTKTEEVKLKVKLWLEESDITTKIIQKSEICSYYRIGGKAFDAIAASLDENSAKSKSKRFKAATFMTLPDGESPILLPGVPSVGVTILGGSPGCGKTTLVMDMAASIIFGDDILGDVPTRTGSVLIVSSDEPHPETQHKMINRGLAGVDDDKLEIMTDWDVSQWHELEIAIEEVRPTCVFLDSFNAIHYDPSFDENTSQAAHTIKKLERLSTKYCVPIVITHHLSKSKDNKGTNELRGSTAIAASCSSIMLMKTMDDGSKLLTQPKIRGSEPLNLMLEMDAENGRFTIIGDGAVDDSTKSLGDRLKAFFIANQGQLFEMAEIKDKFPSEDRKVLTNALNRLVKRGEIVKRPSKVNVRSKVYGINRTDGDFTSSPNDPPPLNKKIKIDDSISETIENKGITASSSCHHLSSTLSGNVPLMTSETIENKEIAVSLPCHHLSSTLSDDIRLMTSEIVENKGIESPRHHRNPLYDGGGVSGDITDDHAMPTDQGLVEPIEWEDLKAGMKAEIERLGWDKAKTRLQAQIWLSLSKPIANMAALNDEQLITVYEKLKLTPATNYEDT